jgi:hypothetical protein
VGAAAVIPACCGLAAIPARAEPAIGQFEIKTLSAEPGEVEFQSQNAYFSGLPARRLYTGGGELEADDNAIARQRHGLEVEVGLSRFLKTRLGIEYERERIDDIGSPGEAEAFAKLALDEYAAEAVAVFVPRAGDGWGLGMVVEYEHPADSDEARTLNAGPIFEFAQGPWIASFNPTITRFSGGERNAAGAQDEKLDFSYTARLMHQWSDQLALALEAYGTVERIAGAGQRSQASSLFGDFNQHRAGPVAYWTVDTGTQSETTIGLGALFGLNSNTEEIALKFSLEVTF